MGDVGEGASLDLAVLAIGFAEENGGGELRLARYGGDVHAYIIQQT
jgi:hypothetical protein